MTEKEFLIHFMNWLNLNKYDGKDLECYIESFLNHYHEDFYEVEFVKKEQMDNFYKEMDNVLREEQEAKEGIKGWDI